MLVMYPVVIVQMICTDLRLQIIDQTRNVPSICIGMPDINEHVVFFVTAHLCEFLLVQQHVFLQDRAGILNIDRTVKGTEHLLQFLVVFMCICQHLFLAVGIHTSVVQVHGKMPAPEDPGIFQGQPDMMHGLFVLPCSPGGCVFYAEYRSMKGDRMLLQKGKILPERLLKIRHVKHGKNLKSEPAAISLRIFLHAG